MLQPWMQFGLGVALATAAWISSLDTTGSVTATSALWIATGAVAAHLLFRLLKSER